MNAMLNGTGWGEARVKEKELEIPYFMTVDWKRMERRIAEAEEARRAAAIGAERRKLRRKARAERNFRMGFAVLIVVSGLLVVVNALMELIL